MSTPNQPGREKEIFEQAIELHPAEARLGYVKGACGSDAGLLARLETLLRAHEATGGFLPEEPGAAAADPTVRFSSAETAENAGSVIGRYKLLQKLGEGGCGVVYMAEQEVPVRRRVALKVIKLGMDTKAVIARFEAERQALAMMDHPNIAKVLDAGATETGRPYFVMELVRGLPITRYCDENNLPTIDRLNLFTQVCQAIQHAHQKGIIHRDIKPSNILVTLHDGMAVPKVIDFGIAKATLGRLTDQTVFTAFEQFIGTPAYMSPEQAEMSGLDIDTRSDIYSLGVLLYELLTGKPPFDPQTLVKAGLDEIRRLIREVEPPKPSTRLSTLTSADGAALAKLRGTDAAKLSVLIRGDLDWIVMKALDKNRTRRYETAGAFAADIQRHLHNEPVTARPPSTAYLLQKLISRNRLAFAAAAAIAAALVIGFGFSTWSFIQEKAARQRAVAAEAEQSKARQQAEADRERAVTAEKEQSKARVSAEEARTNEAKQRVLAEAEEKKAKIAATKSEQAFKFMSRMLEGVGPSVAAGRDTTLLREILDKTVKKLDKDMKDQPEVDENLRGMLGGVYADLGDYPKAEAMAREALAKSKTLFGHDHADTADALALLGVTRMSQGHGDESEAIAQEALAIVKSLPGDQHEKLARSIMLLGLAQLSQGKVLEAEAQIRAVLVIVQHDPDIENLPPDTAQSMLASVLQREGRLAEAEPLMREALAAQKGRLGNDHPMVAYSMAGLASVLMSQGKFPEAEAMTREALVILKKSLGPEHPNIGSILLNLAVIVQQQGRFPEAEAQYREALALQEKVLGKEHPITAQIRALLTQVLQAQRKTAEAEAVQKAGETATSPAKEPGAEEVAEAGKKTDKAMAAMQQGKFAEAEKNLREALPVLEKALGGSHQGVIGTRVLLGQALIQLGKFAEAEAVARDQLPIVRKAFGDKSSYVANTLFLIATPAQMQGRLVEAETALREALAISKLLTTDGENANVAAALLQLATVKAGQGASQIEIEFLRTEAVNIARKLPASVSTQVASTCLMMVDVLMKYDKHAEAEPIARVIVAGLRQLLGGEGEELAWRLTTLTWVLNLNGKYEEGEAAAREAVDIRKKLLSRDDWRIYAAKYSVGESLLKEKKYSEAEALLLEVFPGLKKHGPEKSSSFYGFWQDQSKHTAERLVELYTETKQPAKAVEWKKKTDEYTSVDKETLQKEVAPSPVNEPGTKEVAAADKKTQVAMTAMRQEKFAEAEANLREALPVLEKALGGSHQAVLGTRMMLSQALLQLGKFAEADAVARDQLPIVRKAFGDKSTIVATTLFMVATPAQLQGKLVEAEAALREALAISKEQTTDGENANVAAALLQLATVKAGQGTAGGDAEQLRGEAARITHKLPESVMFAIIANTRAMVDQLMKFGKPAEAEPIKRVLVAYVRQRDGGESEELTWQLADLTWVLNANGKYEEGEAAAREAVEMRKKLMPHNDWRVYAAELSVGQSLVGQKKYAEAEALLLEIFPGLKKRGPTEKADPSYDFWRGRFKRTAELLIDIYTATNQPGKVTEWKKKLEEYASANTYGK